MSYLKEQFAQIYGSEDTTEISDFITELLKSNELEILEQHYGFLKESKTSPAFYQALCRSFSKHGEKGERFLLDKIIIEPNPQLQGVILQILGSMKYQGAAYLPETLQIARTFIASTHDLLRKQAAMVLGWIGEGADLDNLMAILQKDHSAEVRAFCASAMMQLYLRDLKLKEKKQEILHSLVNASKLENSPALLNSILIAVQEISKEKLGLSASAKQIPSQAKLEKARLKALQIIDSEGS